VPTLLPAALPLPNKFGPAANWIIKPGAKQFPKLTNELPEFLHEKMAAEMPAQHRNETRGAN
jgi:hypothetical protein